MGSNFPLTTSLGDLDLLGAAGGAPDFERARAEVTALGELQVPVASVQDLIAMKLAANRPKDRDHVRELRAILKERGQG